jgi:hypothetical protein
MQKKSSILHQANFENCTTSTSMKILYIHAYIRGYSSSTKFSMYSTSDAGIVARIVEHVSM